MTAITAHTVGTTAGTLMAQAIIQVITLGDGIITAHGTGPIMAADIMAAIIIM